MISFNIDELGSKHIDAHIERDKHLRSLGVKYNNRINRVSYGYSVGWHAGGLLDWRRLERRCFELETKRAEWNSAYWSSLKNFHATAVTSGVEEVWLVDRYSAWGDVIVFDGQGTRHAKHKDLVEKYAVDPSKKALVITGDDATTMHRLKEREKSFSRRAGAYWTALHYAVDDRLRAFIDANLFDSHVHFYTAASFLISNDERQYVITLNSHGQLTWGSQLVYVSH